MFCTRCGKENVEGAQFCCACGHDLTEGALPESTREMTDTLEHTGQDTGGSDYIEKHAGLDLDMIWVPGGTFQMGGNEKDTEQPVHAVELDGFWLGKYPVTQRECEAVVGSNPSAFKGAARPVEEVSWDDAMAFCRKVSEATNKQYTLPTEAQWEYACRGGNTGKWCFGDDETQLGQYAWYKDNSGTETHPVGQKRPNAWGLHDMHGNVLEWCRDSWHDNYTGAPTDGSAWETPMGKCRVIRGGCWANGPWYCRSAIRLDPTAGLRYFGLGFRLSRTP